MPLVHAVVLGIVQGLTEFLPVSSSGHLVVLPWLLGWTELASDAELKRAFDVALHMGTFAGALAYLWRDVVDIARHRRRHGALLLVSALPAAAVGAVLGAVAEDQLSAEWLVGVMLVVFGVVLAWADRLPGERREADLGLREALLMGAAQATALQPGVSRSGATMSMGRYLGFERNASARLSFLMSLPVIAGAGAYEGARLVAGGGLPPGFAPAFAWGTLASAATGFLAVWGLLRYVRTRSFRPFVAYRIVAGLFVIAVAFAR